MKVSLNFSAEPAKTWLDGLQKGQPLVILNISEIRPPTKQLMIVEIAFLNQYAAKKGENHEILIHSEKCDRVKNINIWIEEYSDFLTERELANFQEPIQR